MESRDDAGSRDGVQPRSEPGVRRVYNTRATRVLHAYDTRTRACHACVTRASVPGVRDNAGDVYQAAAVIGVSSTANISAALTLAMTACLIKLSLPTPPN